MTSSPRPPRHRSDASWALQTAPTTARALAGVIDLLLALVLSAGQAVVLHLLGMSWAFGIVIAVIIVTLARLTMVGLSGWSPGGKALGVRLVNARTGKPSMMGAFLHMDITVVLLLSTLGLGAIWLMRSAASDPSGRGWHDHLAEMMVVSSRKARPARVQQGQQVPTISRPTEDWTPEVFSPDRFSFTSPSSPQTARTFDSGAMIPPPEQEQAIIDSVPWSSVPVPLDDDTTDIPAVVPLQRRQRRRAVSHEAPASPQALETPYALGAPQAPATPQAVETPQAPATPQALETPQAPATPQALETPQAPGAPYAPEALAVPAPKAPRTMTNSPSTGASRVRRSIGVHLVPVSGGEPILLVRPAVVGRDPDNISLYPDAVPIALADPERSVSKTHAALAPTLDGVWVTDLHSTNGTRIEQRNRTVAATPDVPAPALGGAVIRFGRTAYRVEV